MFSGPAWLLAQFYGLTHSYAVSIALITVVVMALITPLTLKSTKSMLEMQRVQPEMRRLQQQYKNDRQKLNEEMMKLYSEHKVNPLASCLPLLAQMPVFFIMFRLIHGLTKGASPEQASQLKIPVGSFAPQYVGKGTELYLSLLGKTEMNSFGLDLSKSPKDVMTASFGRGIIYALLVVVLAALYWVQQRQIASRTVNPTMSAGQQKLMQYLPVAFAVFQLFFPTGLVVYYITQTILRIGQNQYVTRRFYGGHESLGRQAQRAGEEARELAKQHKDDKSGDGSRGGRPPKAARPTPSKPSPASRSSKSATNAKSSQGGKPSPAGKPKPAGRATPPSRPARPSGPTGSGASGTRHPKPKKK